MLLYLGNWGYFHFTLPQGLDIVGAWARSKSSMSMFETHECNVARLYHLSETDKPHTTGDGYAIHLEGSHPLVKWRAPVPSLDLLRLPEPTEADDFKDVFVAIGPPFMSREHIPGTLAKFYDNQRPAVCEECSRLCLPDLFSR